jgi:hypothetical protein
MCVDKERVVYASAIVGGVYFFALGATLLFGRATRPAGALLPIAFGLTIGTIGFIGLRQKLKRPRG